MFCKMVAGENVFWWRQSWRNFCGDNCWWFILANLVSYTLQQRVVQDFWPIQVLELGLLLLHLKIFHTKVVLGWLFHSGTSPSEKAPLFSLSKWKGTPLSENKLKHPCELGWYLDIFGISLHCFTSGVSLLPVPYISRYYCWWLKSR